MNIFVEYLLVKGCKLLVEESIVEEFEIENFKSCNFVIIGKEVDFVVVVGGDGSMFGVVCVFVCFDIYVVGVNCGNFGFLIDIYFDDIV